MRKCPTGPTSLLEWPIPTSGQMLYMELDIQPHNFWVVDKPRKCIIGSGQDSEMGTRRMQPHQGSLCSSSSPRFLHSTGIYACGWDQPLLSKLKQKVEEMALQPQTSYINQGKLLDNPHTPCWSRVYWQKPTEISSGTNILTHSRTAYRDQAGLRPDSRKVILDLGLIMVKEVKPVIRWDQALGSSYSEMCRNLAIWPIFPAQYTWSRKSSYTPVW